MDLKKQLEEFSKKFQQEIEQVSSVQHLEQFRVKFLGRSGQLNELMKQIKEVPDEDRREIGPALNKLKQESEFLFDNKKLAIESNQEKLSEKPFDVTAYKPGQKRGSLHPKTYFTEKIEDAFTSMGYSIVDGPEIETDYYNFEALNIPRDHPARDMQDTFWLNIPDMLMRTHTSPVQIRELEKNKLPVAIMTSGRCYRNESTDASHDFVFDQVEALVVGEDISLGNLIATIKQVLQNIFEKDDLDIRVRASYFPFVEPAIEVDMMCPFCKEGCSTCKQTRWIEIVGSGLVHPNVLKACNIDPKRYSGFAFCFGLTRLIMLKYGINDIRLLNSGKLEFLNQFKN